MAYPLMTDVAAVPAVPANRAQQRLRFGLSAGPLPVMPFSVVFQNNQILNREFIDAFGIFPSRMVAARNTNEKLEIFIDHAAWWVCGMAVPLLIGRRYNDAVASKLARTFHLHPPKINLPKSGKSWLGRFVDRVSLYGRTSALQVPWQWLDRSTVFKRSGSAMAVVAKEMGCRDVPHLNALLKDEAFRSAVLKGKTNLLVIDTVGNMFNGLISFFGRNWITRYLIGHEGFSGELKYASKDYMEEQSTTYQKNQRKLFRNAVLSSVLGSITGLPLFIRGTLALKRPGTLGKTLKQVLPALNYSNAIFMSKWAVLWSAVFSYMIPSLLASRDKHEFRETLVRDILLFGAYTVGDDMAYKWGSQALQRNVKSGLKPSVNFLKRVPGKGSHAVSLESIVRQVGDTHPAYRWMRTNFWGSLIFATLLSGLAVPLMNNWYTKKKVLEDMGTPAPPRSRSEKSEKSAKAEKPEIQAPVFPVTDRLLMPMPQRPVPQQPFLQGQRIGPVIRSLAPAPFVPPGWSRDTYGTYDTYGAFPRQAYGIYGVYGVTGA
ncbi:MAG: hypothetical protein KC474_06310 [Cyanobacteria bacterium HKST-UBA04]|nr:hypothetical protein [Cyanobacteria bacterium HKST-UBA04]